MSNDSVSKESGKAGVADAEVRELPTERSAPLTVLQMQIRGMMSPAGDNAQAHDILHESDVTTPEAQTEQAGVSQPRTDTKSAMSQGVIADDVSEHTDVQDQYPDDVSDFTYALHEQLMDDVSEHTDVQDQITDYMSDHTDILLEHQFADDVSEHTDLQESDNESTDAAPSKNAITFVKSLTGMSLDHQQHRAPDADVEMSDAQLTRSGERSAATVHAHASGVQTGHAAAVEADVSEHTGDQTDGSQDADSDTIAASQPAGLIESIANMHINDAGSTETTVNRGTADVRHDNRDNAMDGRDIAQQQQLTENCDVVSEQAIIVRPPQTAFDYPAHAIRTAVHATVTVTSATQSDDARYESVLRRTIAELRSLQGLGSQSEIHACVPAACQLEREDEHASSSESLQHDGTTALDNRQTTDSSATLHDYPANEDNEDEVGLYPDNLELPLSCRHVPSSPKSQSHSV